MRPITILYPLDYDLPTQATSPLYQTLVQIVAPTGASIANVPQFTLANYEAALSFLQETQITNQPKNNLANQPVTPAAAKVIINDILSDKKNALRLSQVYGAARQSLIAAIGQFCSFCELFVGDSSLAIEHMLPKSKFFDRAATQRNFLLACPMCNAFKSDNPTPTNYNWPINWSKTALSNPPTWDDYSKIQRVIYNAYMWPQYEGAYQAFPHTLQYQAGTTWTAAPAPNAATDVITSHTGGIIKAKLQGLAGVVAVKVNVGANGGQLAPKSVTTSLPKFPKGANNALKSSASMTGPYAAATGLGLLYLNNYDTSSRFSDRRLYNRTLTWFVALAAFNRLNQAQNAGGYQLMLEEVCSTATSKGFFSTWVTVFNTLAPATPGATGPTPAGGGSSQIPNATVDLIMNTTVNAGLTDGFAGTNIKNSIP
jgi:hypothetical protein